MSQIVLQAERLTKRFGALAAVDNLSLAVRQGEVFGLLGPNGAGKTTSINMMCGLLKPDAGRVWIHDRPVTGGQADVRARVGVCPQEIIIWSHLTCLEQLIFIGQMYGVETRTAKKRGQHLLAKLGLSEKSSRQGRTLSGGMQRRLNLALALVHDPEILVLDEPEAGLDPQSRVAVRAYIKELAQIKTVILTTHNMDEADRLADRVAIIDHGRLLVLDRPQALKRRLGAGDVLEISLKGNGKSPAEAVTALTDKYGREAIDVSGEQILLRIHDAVGALPGIAQSLEEAGAPAAEIRLRENTLEDVFIQLTGRRLRE